MLQSLIAPVRRSLNVRLVSKSAVALTMVGALTANFLFASMHDQQRCAEIVAVCIIAIVALIRLAQGPISVVPRTTGAVLMAFLILGLVSASAAYSLHHAVYEWSMTVLLIMLVFAISAELTREDRRLEAVLWWSGIACGVYSLRLLLMYFAALASGFQVGMHDLTVGFSNARFLNHTQTALLPLIILLYLRAPPTHAWRKGWFMLAAFWWALLFVCEARASVMALAIACAVAFGLRRSHAREFMLAMLSSALVGAVMYGLLFILLPVLVGLDPVGSPLNVVARTAADPTSLRNILWKLAFDLIAAHPWLGVGPQHFAHEGAHLYFAAHPHNWLLQIGAEWGIPATLCLLSAIFLGAHKLVRSGARLAATDIANQRMLVTLQVACAAIFIDGLFSGVIVMPQSQLAIALVLGVACAWVRGHDIGPIRTAGSPSTAGRIVMATLIVVSAGGLIWSVAPDFVRHARGEPLTPAELAANPAQHWPRTWDAGYF